MGKSKIKRWLSIFDEIKDLGEGGNADVYLVTEKTTGHIIHEKGSQCSFYLKLPKIKVFREKTGSF